MEIGDRHYIWGQNGVKGYDPQTIFITGKLHCCGICLYPVIILFKVYIWHTKYFRTKCLVSLSIWPFVSLLVRPPVHPFVYFWIKVLF